MTMGKYNDLLDNEFACWKKDAMNYEYEKNKTEDETRAVCDKYNTEIATINSERSSLKELINKLYSFLKEFGDIGPKITPFEFINEEWQSISFNTLLDSPGDIDNPPPLMELKLYAIPSISPIPILVNGILNRKKNKELFCAYQTKHQHALIKYNHNIRVMKNINRYLKLSTKMAKEYYGVISTVKEAISSTILPELSGIRAFLYDCSVAARIGEKKELVDIKPISIQEIENTVYNEHFIFVRNTVDYYILITKIFTNTILTNMLEDKKVTSNEKQAFYKHMEEIEQMGKDLCDKTVFREEC